MSVALPAFKGATGWEFTALGKDFSLDAYAPVVGGPLMSVSPAHVLPVPEGVVDLLQVDGATSDTQPPAAAGTGGTLVADGPVVLPLDVAVAEHPELVEPWLGSVVALDDDADGFVVANERSWKGGAFVYVPRGVRVDVPILLTSVNAVDGTALHRRTLIVLEEGAEAEVWEQHLSADAEGACLLNTVVEIVVGQNARLRYLNAQDLNERSVVIGTQRADVGRDAVLEWAALGFGSANGRVRMVTTLSGTGAEARVTGAYAPHARQHFDYDTYQEHAAPNCISNLAFRGILADRSSSVWRGMIKVDPGAQQTDGFQDCRNLLLTKRAHADAIPGLEILANDVRCTHAAAVGQIDSDQLFYLRTRGLSLPAARRLIIEGFLSELVARFSADSLLRSGVADALERRLELIL
ncbi:MAG: Fe-S cluster assembly protein SufD [Solirubrobacteraceae bacterium]